MMTLSVKKARQIALVAHRGQKDKSGRPYYEHLDAVHKGVQVLGGSKDAEIAALFHDIVEDTKATIKDLKDLGASEKTIVIVEALTKRSSEEQGKYLARIVKAGPDAMRVKVADLLHNTRHDRLAALNESTRDRLLKKYRPALAHLLLELNMIVDEDEQKKLATKPSGTATGWESTYTPNAAGELEVTASSMIRGDWPVGMSAPLQVHAPYGKKTLLLLLADGTYEIIGRAKKVKVKVEHRWSYKPENAEFKKVLKEGTLFDDKQEAEALVQMLKDRNSKKRSKKTEEAVL